MFFVLMFRCFLRFGFLLPVLCLHFSVFIKVVSCFCNLGIPILMFCGDGDVPPRIRLHAAVVVTAPPPQLLCVTKLHTQRNTHKLWTPAFKSWTHTHKSWTDTHHGHIQIVWARTHGGNTPTSSGHTQIVGNYSQTMEPHNKLWTRTHTMGTYTHIWTHALTNGGYTLYSHGLTHTYGHTR